jgi:hypothetical protein
MNASIVCKPTPWFLFRAAAMLLMFGIFTVLFFVDGKWGYREQNLSYFVAEAFQEAARDFKLKKEEITPAAWRAFAARQSIDFVHREAQDEEGEVVPVPAGTPVPMPWPPVLHDYEALKAAASQSPGKLFDDYRLEADIKKDAPEHAFPQRKISEQWVVFWICLVLTAGTLAVLLRVLGRSMAIDGEAFYPAAGGKVPFADLVRLDLRKWDTKGLAFAHAKTAAGGERKLRIDGLTYGGFKPEWGEPAEQLMRALRENFTGEVIEYLTEPEPAAPSAGATPGA